jgi:CBS domain-containing protein
MTQLDNRVRGALSRRAPVCFAPEHTIREAAVELYDTIFGAAPLPAADLLVGVFSRTRHSAAGGRCGLMPMQCGWLT